MFPLQVALYKCAQCWWLLTAAFYILAVALTHAASGSLHKSVSSGISNFGNKLYASVSEMNTANLIFSPISVHSVLSLAYQGAANETAKVLRRVLDVPQTNVTAASYKRIMDGLLSSSDVDVRFANKICIKSGYELYPKFRSTAQKDFWADAEAMDFTKQEKSAAEVNKWVSKNTGDRIRELVSANDFDELSRLVLLNAVYFKGKWLRAFNTKYTSREKFHKNEMETIECQMMKQTAKFDHVFSEEFDAQVLEIRYRDERFSMVIVLPNEGISIGRLGQNMAGKHAKFLKAFLPIRKTVRVFLPQFKIETTLDMKEPLTQIGLGQIFSDDANFSRMIQADESLKIDKIIQKAFVEVNEEGAEAAAATGAVVMLSKSIGKPPSPVVFKADRPFIFYITAKLNGKDRTILFMGKVMAPG